MSATSFMIGENDNVKNVQSYPQQSVCNRS